MILDTEQAAVRGQQSALEGQQLRLVLKIEGLAAALRLGLNVALCPVQEWPAEQVPTLSGQWAELEAAYGELVGVESRLARLARIVANG